MRRGRPVERVFFVPQAPGGGYAMTTALRGLFCIDSAGGS